MEYNQNERADFNAMPNNGGAYQGANNNQRPSVSPKNYLVESILVTILCCLPLGIVGIINATKVEGLFAAGDYDGAQRASDDAKKWCKWGAIGGAVYLTVILIIYIAGVGAALSGAY